MTVAAGDQMRSDPNALLEGAGYGQVGDSSIQLASVDDAMQDGARAFELFWLRPKKYEGREALVRLRLNGKLGGWKLKDELVRSLGLEVGDAVDVEVTVLDGPGIIDDDGDTDLFAGGEAADWLLKTILEAGTAIGCVIDCKVRFMYREAPVGYDNRQVKKASLLLVEGIGFVRIEQESHMATGMRSVLESLKAL